MKISHQLAGMLQDKIITLEDYNRYSGLQVLRSNAGFYIGTMYSNPEGWNEPGSRDSEYFPTAEAAESALANSTYEIRWHA
jgi:hypothetical protein